MVINIQKINSILKSAVFATLTSLHMGGQTPPPIFKIAIKIISHRFRVIRSKGLKTQGSRGLGIKALFAKFRILFFLKITSFSAFLCRKFKFFMIKSQILNAFILTTFCGVVFKICNHEKHDRAFESCAPFFLFSNLKIFYGLF